MPTGSSSAAWLSSANRLISKFAADHALVLRTTERQLSAAFEIACFHALLRFYKKQRYSIRIESLKDGAYRYLTTPSGNPDNFSYITLVGPDGEFEVRQQVRVKSHVADDICFTPDIVVLVKGSSIDSTTSEAFASGRRRFFSIKSDAVVAAHECKSMNPFPELMVSFIGMLVTAHSWYPNGTAVRPSVKGHLAPTLFVGGTARSLHLKMISAMESSYRLNIVVGMHVGTWSLRAAKNRLHWQGAASSPTQAPSGPRPRRTSFRIGSVRRGASMRTSRTKALGAAFVKRRKSLRKV